MKREVTLIAGDGIGPEITAATLSVLEALGADFDWDEEYGGMSAVETAGTPLPDQSLPVERVVQRDQCERGDADLLRRDAGGGKWGGRLQLVNVRSATTTRCQRGRNRAPRTAH